LLSACSLKGEPSSSSKKGDPFLRCAEPHDDGQTERFELRPLVVERDGHEVEIHGISRGQVVLGLLSGIMEAHPQTIDNIRFFMERFKESGVQAILVAGGMGLEETDLKKILAELAKAPVPILAVPGAQEHFDLFRKTVDEMRREHPQLLDMTRVRRVRIGNLDMVSLPGYYKPYYLLAKNRGCSYQPADLDATRKLIDIERTTVLISPSPPRGTGAHSVDRGRGEANLGDTALAEMMKGVPLPFGLFGHVYEAGGHATASDGTTPLLEGVWHDSMYLQAGAAEAVPVPLVGGGRSVGMAHIVEFSGKRCRYRTVFMEKP